MSNSSLDYCPRIQHLSKRTMPIFKTKRSCDFRSLHQSVEDNEVQRNKRPFPNPTFSEMLPSKFSFSNPSANSKSLYRAHSCGSLFSLQHARNAGHITVRHRRLSSQLCLPVDSLPGVSFGSMSTNGRSAHVTATVFIDIYAPYSPASPTLIGSPVSPQSSGDDFPSFRGKTMVIYLIFKHLCWGSLYYVITNNS